VMFIGQVRGASCCCTESHLPVAYGALLAALRGGRRISHKLIAYLHEACAIAPAAFLLSLAIATYALLWAGLPAYVPRQLQLVSSALNAVRVDEWRQLSGQRLILRLCAVVVVWTVVVAFRAAVGPPRSPRRAQGSRRLATEVRRCRDARRLARLGPPGRHVGLGRARRRG